MKLCFVRPDSRLSRTRFPQRGENTFSDAVNRRMPHERLHAVDFIQRAEELGSDITLIAQRYLGPDLDSWTFATALAAQNAGKANARGSATATPLQPSMLAAAALRSALHRKARHGSNVATGRASPSRPSCPAG